MTITKIKNMLEVRIKNSKKHAKIFCDDHIDTAFWRGHLAALTELYKNLYDIKDIDRSEK
jgi:hypothetical protein